MSVSNRDIQQLGANTTIAGESLLSLSGTAEQDELDLIPTMSHLTVFKGMSSRGGTATGTSYVCGSGCSKFLHNNFDDFLEPFHFLFNCTTHASSSEAY
jgi:hypothetical protein